MPSMTPAEEVLAYLVLSGQLRNAPAVAGENGSSISYALSIPETALSVMPVPTGVAVETFRDAVSGETRIHLRVAYGRRYQPRLTDPYRFLTDPWPVVTADPQPHPMPYIDPTLPHS